MIGMILLLGYVLIVGIMGILIVILISKLYIWCITRPRNEEDEENEECTLRESVIDRFHGGDYKDRRRLISIEHITELIKKNKKYNYYDEYYRVFLTRRFIIHLINKDRYLLDLDRKQLTQEVNNE